MLSSLIKNRFLFSLIFFPTIIIGNLDLTNFSSFKLFEYYSSLGEDAAQLLNSISFYHNQGFYLSSIWDNAYSPFIDSLSFIVGFAISLLMSQEITSIMISTTIVYILPVLIINIELILKIKQNNLIEIINKIVIIISLNLIISPSIKNGHISLIYSVALLYFALHKKNNSLKKYVYLIFAVLSWYPSIILIALLFLEPAQKSFHEPNRSLFRNKVVYFSVISLIITMITVYWFVESAKNKAEWEFDLLRESGGVENSSISIILTLLLLIIVIMFFNDRLKTSLNFEPIYLISVPLVFFILFNVFYVATSSSYGIQKLLTFYSYILLLLAISYYIQLSQFNTIQMDYASYILPTILLIFIVFGNSTKSFIDLYSRSDIESQSGINETQFSHLVTLLNSNSNYYILQENYLRDGNNLQSYLTSRWASSLLGKDDRRIANQMGWRFTLLGRIKIEEFFCCYSSAKSKFLMFDGDSYVYLDPNQVIRILNRQNN